MLHTCCQTGEFFFCLCSCLFACVFLICNALSSQRQRPQLWAQVSRTELCSLFTQHTGGFTVNKAEMVFGKQTFALLQNHVCCHCDSWAPSSGMDDVETHLESQLYFSFLISLSFSAQTYLKRVVSCDTNTPLYSFSPLSLSFCYYKGNVNHSRKAWICSSFGLACNKQRRSLLCLPLCCGKDGEREKGSSLLPLNKEEIKISPCETMNSNF